MTWHKSDYSYRIEWSVSNSNSFQVEDYRIKFDIIDSTDYNTFWNTVQSSGYDVRWTDSNGNDLSFYRAVWDYSGKDADFWVVLPNISASGSITVYMYFGYASATDASSQANTCPGGIDNGRCMVFKEDFESFTTTGCGQVHGNNGWIDDGSGDDFEIVTDAYSGSRAARGGGSKTSCTADETSGAYQNPSITIKHGKLRFWMKSPTSGDNHGGMEIWDSNNNKVAGFRWGYSSGSSQSYIDGTGNWYATGDNHWVTGTWYKTEITFDAVREKNTYVFYGSSTDTYSNINSPSYTSADKFLMKDYGSAAYPSFDDIEVWYYLDTEPSPSYQQTESKTLPEVVKHFIDQKHWIDRDKFQGFVDSNHFIDGTLNKK